jgi:hypothetical protein|tara:strand:- start:88 stop:396 length:309 start_codon:yes stop_codon:yes gene_type:complete
MAEVKKPEFVEGVYVEESPKDFVIAKQRMNVNSFLRFLDNPYVKEFIKKNNGYLNMDVLKGRTGKFHIKFNEFIPERKVTTVEHNPDRNLDDYNGDNPFLKN